MRAIFEDASGGLWLGTDADGLKHFDPSTNAFDRYGDVIAHAFANAPSKHPDLRVAVQVKKNARAEATPAPLTDLRVTALAGTGAGRLWVATNHGIALFDPSRRSANVLALGGDDDALADAEVRSILSARDGRLWLGTASDGLVRFDAPAERWQILRADTGAPRLSSNTVLALHQDRNGAIWIGTLNGLDVTDATRHDRACLPQ